MDGCCAQALRQYADDPSFQADWQTVKRTAKLAATEKISALTGTVVSPDAMLDIQVKRIHEYKRQLLNVLGIIHRYDELRRMSDAERSQVSACGGHRGGTWPVHWRRWVF